MKKKIRLRAAVKASGEIVFYPPDAVTFIGAVPHPEFDIEKEIECEDEPEKLMEFWVDKLQANYVIEYEPAADLKGSYIHVREVLPDSIQVTREMIENAWNKMAQQNMIFSKANLSRSFENLCRELGFAEGKK